MKSAKEWVEGWNQCSDFNDETWIELQAKDLIEAIERVQADVFRTAAEICANTSLPENPCWERIVYAGHAILEQAIQLENSPTKSSS